MSPDEKVTRFPRKHGGALSVSHPLAIRQLRIGRGADGCALGPAVAAVAIALAESGGPDALVLTSAILTGPQSKAVPKMALETLRIPVLVIHHQQDGCKHCLASNLPALLEKLPACYQVRTYEGGSNLGDPCDAMAHHRFNGLEARVVQDLSTWLATSVARWRSCSQDWLTLHPARGAQWLR